MGAMDHQRRRLPRIDYDDKQYRGYAQGRALSTEVLQLWLDLFVRYAPDRRPLRVLDLGSGIGRFTPALAQTFGGPVVGVEPSAKMRAIAERQPPADNVTYTDGRAEQIPLPDGSVDLVLMFLSFHHVADRDAAASEVARVLVPDGRLILRSAFGDRIPDLRWHRYFPSAREIEERLFPTLAETERVFAGAGLRRVAFEEVHERRAGSLAEATERLKHRATSIFDYLDEDEIRTGFAAMDAAVAAERDGREPEPVVERSDVLVLAR
jgi:ubiquinone/menaquinone biosynthesis C-methylase UbiE